MKYKIIDVHAHFFPDELAKRAVDNLGSYYNYVMHGNGTFDDLVESSESAGIEKLVVHSTALKGSQVENVNNNTAAHISENICGFGSLHPDYEGDFEKEVRRIKTLGLRGIKLHPDFQHFDIDDKRLYNMYEIVSAEGLPILFHVGDINSNCSSPRKLAKVIKDFPNLTAIAAHLGGYSRWEEAKECLIGKNLYLDTSSCSRFLSLDEIRNIIRKHDIEKVMFGTDYPLERHDYCVESFLKLDLSDKEFEKIFYQNAEKLIFNQ